MFNIAALLDPSVYPHTVTQCELIETHISWVILTGAYAYKIKKPVNYGFLDFSTLEKRHKYCQEELRLNRRLAGNIYIEVVAITGTFEQPEVTEHLINGNNVIEYAVKMQQFPQQDQLDRMLAADKLLPGHIDAFADRIAEFHQQIDIADMSTIYGNVEQVCVPLQENLAQIRNSVRDSEHRSVLVELEQWGNSEFKTLKNVFLQRKQAGFVRECHGDMHLRNLAWIENKPVLFDCIEFNAELRWIDVISDIAFLVMDLQDRDQPQLAQRFLNRYLEITGDYEGVAVLPYYLFYRALVRAKVDAIRASQSGISQKEKSDAERDMAGYLKLA
ncbi:MAG: phosphotransferase, partial [Gammaproteobacteria bacterium]|nr:phosphotransferase [Gammaproteobacteria bacterium]